MYAFTVIGLVNNRRKAKAVSKVVTSNTSRFQMTTEQGTVVFKDNEENIGQSIDT